MADETVNTHAEEKTFMLQECLDSNLCALMKQSSGIDRPIERKVRLLLMLKKVESEPDRAREPQRGGSTGRAPRGRLKQGSKKEKLKPVIYR
jgi:hypothetical protein